MGTTNYNVRVYNNQNKAAILSLPFIELEIGQKRHSVGALSIAIPLQYFDANVIQFGSLIEVWREHSSTNTMKLIDGFIVVKWILEIDKNQCEIIAYDCNYMLTTRSFPYPIVDPTFFQILETVTSYGTLPENFDKLDDTMKYMVIYSFTYWGIDPRAFDTTRSSISAVYTLYAGLPYSNRVNQYVEIAPFTSLGANLPFYVQDGEDLLTALIRCSLQSKVAGSDIEFRVRYVPATYSDNQGGTFLFETAVPTFGKDLTDNVNTPNAVIIHADQGGLANVKVTIDYTNYANLIYLQGMEFNSWLQYLNLPSPDDGVYQYLTASALDNGYASGDHTIGIVEKIVKASADVVASSLELLELNANLELNNQKPTIKIEGDIINQDTVMFFADYNYLDTISIEGFGYSFNAKIDQYTLNVKSDGTDVFRIPFNATANINDISNVIVQP